MKDPIEFACDQDRLFFKTHKDRTYRRDLIPGEFGDYDCSRVICVEVTYIADGLRSRIPIEALVKDR